jgi:hypothetical protein
LAFFENPQSPQYPTDLLTILQSAMPEKFNQDPVNLDQFFDQGHGRD